MSSIPLDLQRRFERRRAARFRPKPRTRLRSISLKDRVGSRRCPRIKEKPTGLSREASRLRRRSDIEASDIDVENRHIEHGGGPTVRPSQYYPPPRHLLDAQVPRISTIIIRIRASSSAKNMDAPSCQPSTVRITDVQKLRHGRDKLARDEGLHE